MNLNFKLRNIFIISFLVLATVLRSTTAAGGGGGDNEYVQCSLWGNGHGMTIGQTYFNIREYCSPYFTLLTNDCDENVSM